MNFILITALDGTLLGQHDFDFGLIKSDILNLLDSGYPLVLASSKTKAEIESFCESSFGNVSVITNPTIPKDMTFVVLKHSRS